MRKDGRKDDPASFEQRILQADPDRQTGGLNVEREDGRKDDPRKLRVVKSGGLSYRDGPQSAPRREPIPYMRDRELEMGASSGADGQEDPEMPQLFSMDRTFLWVADSGAQ